VTVPPSVIAIVVTRQSEFPREISSSREINFIARQNRRLPGFGNKCLKTFSPDFKNAFFCVFISTDMSKSRQQKFSPQTVELSSQLRDSFCSQYFYHLSVIICFTAMVNELFMARNSLYRVGQKPHQTHGHNFVIP